jgi:hypothetical protein
VDFVLVLVAVAIVAGLAVFVFRRRRVDELHSVAGYRAGLDKLEDLRKRQSSTVRVIGGQNAGSEEADHHAVPPPARRMLFDDTTRTRPPPTSENRPRPRPVRSRPVSMARISRRPRRLGAPIAAAVAVIVLVSGLAIAGAHSRQNPHHNTTATTAPPRRTQSRVSRPATTTQPTTTIPSTFSPTSTGQSSATYGLPFSSYTVAFQATNGSCWIQITAADGTVPYAQTLTEGSTYHIVLTGNSKVELGAPGYASITVDDTPVAFPSSYGAPFTMTFNAAPSTTTTPTT